MKIWGSKAGGNPLRVAIFLAEKNCIDIPFQPVDLMTGEHRKPEFLAKNPMGLVPVLELDDGSCISESVAICRYLERLYPEPALMGRSPLEEAVIDMWQRRLELGFYYSTRAVMRHSVPALKTLEPVQIAEWADLNRSRAVEALEVIEPQLASHSFIAGNDFTIADITAVLPFQMMGLLAMDIPTQCPSVARWRDAIFSRPSVASVVKQPHQR